jgi:sensor histidine kinase YesM
VKGLWSKLTPPSSSIWGWVALIGMPFWISVSMVRLLTTAATPVNYLQHLSIALLALASYAGALTLERATEDTGGRLPGHLAIAALFALGIQPVLRMAGRIPAAPLLTTLDYLLSYGFCLALILIVRTNLKLREVQLARAALESAAMHSQMQALRMQLNPHFAFNALNSIAALLDREPQRARSLLMSMSELFRRTLATANTEQHALDAELGIAQNYLAVQRERFGARFSYELQIDPETRACSVPTLLLQPLVENAVVHGVADDRHQLRIWIRAWIAGGRDAALKLWIEIGNQSSGSILLANKGTGLGLGTTQQRLLTAYGSRSDLRVLQPDLGTFVVMLNLPVSH